MAASLRRCGEGYGALLAERVQVPHPTRPPGDGPRGCLLCGVAAVLALPREARDAWRPVSASASALGAASGSRLHGHLCPACSTAVDAAGALGPTALEGALFAHLAPDAAARLGPYSTVEVVGVRGWGAFVADAHRAGRPTPAPNATPWAHAGDLAALTAALCRAAGVA